MKNRDDSVDPCPDTDSGEFLEHESDVLLAIRGTPFGTVEVVVHQSRIVQITRTEKIRYESR